VVIKKKEEKLRKRAKGEPTESWIKQIEFAEKIRRVERTKMIEKLLCRTQQKYVYMYFYYFIRVGQKIWWCDVGVFRPSNTPPS